MLVSNFLKNTSLIDDRDLAFETYLVSYFSWIFQIFLHQNKFLLYLQCLLEDDDYGPIADASKQYVTFIKILKTFP